MERGTFNVEGATAWSEELFDNTAVRQYKNDRATALQRHRTDSRPEERVARPAHDFDLAMT